MVRRRSAREFLYFGNYLLLRFAEFFAGRGVRFTAFRRVPVLVPGSRRFGGFDSRQACGFTRVVGWLPGREPRRVVGFERRSFDAGVRFGYSDRKSVV